MAVSPYPWRALARIDRRTCSLLRTLARASAFAGAEAAKAELGGLLGAAITVEPELPAAAPVGTLKDALAEQIVAVVGHANGPTERVRAALEIDPRFAACLVDRALGGTGGSAIPPLLEPLSDAERGVLAYLAARVATSVSQASWEVVAVLSTRASLVGALGDLDLVARTARVTVGDDQGRMRLWVPAHAIGGRAAASRAVMLVELDVSIVVGRASIDGGELGSVVPGDVILPDELVVGADGLGEAELVVEGGASGAWRGTLDARGLCLTQQIAAAGVPVPRGVVMSEERSEGRGEPVTSPAAWLGGSTVEISIELARLAMTVEELSGLRPGEVVETGRAVGREVTLRANGRAIGTGELVDVDGALGVRVLRLAP